tara:strand:- start:756 stop:893 length:138 start_codon:yes stop_codon:yes gene_type:complete
MAGAPKEGQRPSFGAIVSYVEEEKALIKKPFTWWSRQHKIRIVNL